MTMMLRLITVAAETAVSWIVFTGLVASLLNAMNAAGYFGGG